MNNNYFLQDELPPDGSMTDEPESLPDWALEPTGAPEEFGLPKDSSPSKKRVWNRQEVFLAAFAECGKLNKAAEASGISYWTVVHWQKHDVFEFVKRLEHAHQKSAC
jgi:hypothetical protein